MPRPSLSRPPPMTSWPSHDSDVENEPPTAYNVRRHGPTNRKLFFTPTQKTPSTPSPTFLLTRDSITRRYYKQQQLDKTPVKTPLPRRPSNAPSTSRRPKITRLDATPSVNRTLHGSAPDRWRMRQVADLTAWLNHELSANSDAATLPMHQVATSVVFLHQFAQFNAIFRSKNVHNVLVRLANEICSGRLNVSKTIKLASFLKERDELISLLLLNYHPHWLLLALSVLLGLNLATQLDEAVEKAAAGGKTFNHEQVLTQALENAIRNEFLADAPSDSIASREQTSPASQERDRYNALILRRTLAVIYILDVAKRQRDPIIKPNPPLFRQTSEMASTVDVLRRLQRLLLNDHGDIVRFLAQRGYAVSYKSPVFEPFGNLQIANLSEDMRDGTRLCKLASIMRRDHEILTQVIRVGPGHRPATALAIKKQNISVALTAMKECLPLSLQNRFHWHATPHDVAIGNIDKTVAVLWQIAALWMEYVVVDTHKLKEELDVVKNEFRIARRNPDSPSNNVNIDLTSLADSPSKLQIIESCDTDSGDLLLMWCATLCGIYGVEIRDFTEDFRDGAVLCLILHHYCPELMRLDEINRIPAGDHRGAFAAEAEHKHVQKNLDLFMDRCRLIGTIPEIFLSAEATLAPAFRDSLKQESVGRVMQLLASYLFRRMMMQKDTSNARRQVWEIMKNHKGMPETGVLQEIDPVQEQEAVQIHRVVSVDTPQRGHPESTKERSSILDSSHPSTSAREKETGPPRQSDPDRSGGNNGDLAHVYTRMRHVQSRRATRPRPSQLHADKEKAARVILSHYRGYKARQGYTRLRNGIIDLQSSIRGYFARREVDQLRTVQMEKLAQATASREPEEAQPPLPKENSESPIQAEEMPVVTTNESMRSLPVRIGQQILEFIPAFRRHILAMESYSKRMMAHERAHAEHQAATVIQSAARSHLARRTRNHVEAQRHKTRRTWKTCSTEAAKAALRIAENKRRELVKWHEELLTNAIQQAGRNYASEMSRAEAARKEAALQHQKLEELKAAQEATFAAELRRQQKAFKEQTAAVEDLIQTLESRAANAELPGAVPNEGRQEEDLVESMAKLITSNNARDDALRLIFEDLNAERERADRFEDNLRIVRGSDQEAKEDILRLNDEWKQRFEHLEADIQSCHSTVLNGAICMATARYRLQMDDLLKIRSKKERARETWEQEFQKGIRAFEAEESEERRRLTDIVAKLDADTEDLREAALAHESWVEESKKQDAKVSQRLCAVEADLDALDQRSTEKDMAWISATKQFSDDAEEILCLVNDAERYQQEDDCHNDLLEKEIQRLSVAEKRNDMERRLLAILDSAEDAFCKEMHERNEENENNQYCREEIDIQLEQEDQEEALDTEEFAKRVEKIKLASDELEESRSALDEHLGLVDSYIDQLFLVSPSVMVYEGIPDVFEGDISDSGDDCSVLYVQTCEYLEQLYVDSSGEEEQEGDYSLSENSELGTSPESIKNISIGLPFQHHLKTTENSEADIVEHYDPAGIEGEVSLNTTSGLYQRLLDEEREYYNGKTTHDIGVQTGSGPNSLSSTPAHDSNVESGMKHGSDAEAQPSEEEQSFSGYGGDLSSPDKRTSSAPYSQSNDRDSFVYEQSPLSDIDGQVPNISSPYASVNAPPVQIYMPDTMKQSSSRRAPHTEEGSTFESPAPLDTLAQLALQDAWDKNIFETGFRSEYDGQTSDNPLLHSGAGYTPASEPRGKENVGNASGLPVNKNSGLQVYGLRLDSPLRAQNTPMWPQDSDTQKVDYVEHEQLPSQLESVPPSVGELAATSDEEVLEQGPEADDAFKRDMPVNLGDLSVELNAFNIQPHRQSVESVVENPLSANKLEAVMRRISIAASSPEVKSSKRKAAPPERKEPHCDIIRTIFILIRYCSRSDNQLKLRELGISIICDFCVIHRRLSDIMAVEECIDVLTTCAQYHRDQDTIFDPTVRILWEIALRPDGKKMIVESKHSVARLQNVYELMRLQVVREQKNRDRIRQANMIVDIVRKRRADGGSLKSMTEALRTARDQKLSSEVPMKDAHRLLGDLVEIIS